jgi:hypothetical protein
LAGTTSEARAALRFEDEDEVEVEDDAGGFR